MDVIEWTNLKEALAGKAGRLLIISFCLLLCAVFLNRKFVHDRNDPGSIREKIQDVLSAKEQKMDYIMEEAMKLNISARPSALDSLTGDDFYQKDGMALFTASGDSLIFWSDNNIPFELKLVKLVNDENTEEFVRLQDGWYLLKTVVKDTCQIMGIILVKKEYPYQNNYLENVFQQDFKVRSEIQITFETGSNPVYSTHGKYLFSLLFTQEEPISEAESLLLFMLCAISLLFLLSSLYYFYFAISFFNKRKLLLLIAFTVDVIILRFVFLYLEIPEFLYDSRIFGPHYYATSWIAPSLGDLVVNRLIILVIAYVFFLHYGSFYSHLKKIPRHVLHLVHMMVVSALYFILFRSLQNLVEDSSLMLNLNDISNIDIYSLLGFASFTASILSYFFISWPLLLNIWKNSLTKQEYITIAIFSISLILISFATFLRMPCQWPICVLFIIYLLSFYYFFGKKEKIFQLPSIVFFMILFAISSTYILNHHTAKKEIENRKMLANTLSIKRDPVLEYEFLKIEEKILKDSIIHNYLISTDQDNSYEQEISRYIDDRYFTHFWNRYEMQVTACDLGEILNIQPENYLVNCYEYFDNLIREMGDKTISDNLYYIDNQSENNNYLAVFKADSLPADQTLKRIYIELVYKFISETGLGYPELLIDKDVNLGSEISDYSYSRYYGNKLIYKYGDYFYHLEFTPYYRTDSTEYFLDKDGYNHFVKRTDTDSLLIVSRKNPSFFDVVAPFSYLFIFYGIFLLAFITTLIISGGYRKLEMNFRNRFQVAIISIIIISLIILGLITRVYIIDLNNKKNVSYLTERTYSVLVELEHKIGDYESIPPAMYDYVSDLLYKFAQVFFSDINLYQVNGDLIASSRPQIFEEHLLSFKMNRQAFNRIAFEKSLLYIHNEQIGKQEYLSAYIPFRNNQDQIIAYLNLPYFAKQDEMRKEIADFLSAYINIYVLLIVLAILITILVSRYVTQPLQLIREKLRNLSYSHSNEKIEWKREDEIGELVAEYNRTLDELSRSAELLARSERESAWREMAKQVAHEIKNPLTPMKLSVQYLKKAWDEKAPDWNERLDRFTRTIIEQIESLSRIATEFSDFAKMPVANFEDIDLLETIRSSCDLFKDFQNVKISLESSLTECIISADRLQMIRVFNNLINNAVQAIGKKEDGKIDISVFKTDERYRVEIYDNGSGISEDLAGKIFSPSFTTKSSGMGLGLAMVKNILSGIGATISFTSKENEGTTFFIEIPKSESRKAEP